MFLYSSLLPRLAALCFLIIALSSCATTPAPKINVCFSPYGGCPFAIADEIAEATTDLRIQAYALNAKPIADAVVKAKESGVNVEILLDKGSESAQNNGTFFSTLHGIPTRLDGMHTVADSNVIIIDKKVVITGSFSFTREAEYKNAENLVIIRSAGIAGKYLENWDLHYGHAEEFKPLPAPVPAPAPQHDAKTEKKPHHHKKKKKTASTS